MPNPFKKKVKLVTHGSSFHADDVFATSCLKIFYRQTENRGVKIIRSRDPKIIKTGDVVYDVGDIYDPENNLFDHHQAGGAGQRPNGVLYSAFGLIWKHFGRQLVSSNEIHQEIDDRLVQQICAVDTAFNDFKIEGTDWRAWTFDDVVKTFYPDRELGPKAMDEAFKNLVLYFEKFLETYIRNMEKKYVDYQKVEESYQNSEDKRIIVLEKGMSWKKSLISHPEPLFVIYPTDGQTDYHVRAISISVDSVEDRNPFPKEWRGLRDEKLQEVSGVNGAIFVHNSGYLGIAETLENAVEMAKKAIN